MAQRRELTQDTSQMAQLRDRAFNSYKNYTTANEISIARKKLGEFKQSIEGLKKTAQKYRYTNVVRSCSQCLRYIDDNNLIQKLMNGKKPELDSRLRRWLRKTERYLTTHGQVKAYTGQKSVVVEKQTSRIT